MNKATFLNHFLLRPLPERLLCNHSTNKKEAAVLMAIFEKTSPLLIKNTTACSSVHQGKNTTTLPKVPKTELHIILTQRSLNLRHHPGQVCFPGGKVEDTDNSVSHTARREAFEEIHVDCQPCHIIGTLPNHQTLTGFNICPIVAFIEEPQQLIMDNNEVSEIFTIPLSFIMNLNNYVAIHTQRNNQPHTIYYITYQHYKVWGATAAMLYDIAIHFMD